jgi:hypothetical protein
MSLRSERGPESTRGRRPEPREFTDRTLRVALAHRWIVVPASPREPARRLASSAPAMNTLRYAAPRILSARRHPSFAARLELIVSGYRGHIFIPGRLAKGGRIRLRNSRSLSERVAAHFTFSASAREIHPTDRCLAITTRTPFFVALLLLPRDLPSRSLHSMCYAFRHSDAYVSRIITPASASLLLPLHLPLN